MPSFWQLEAYFQGINPGPSANSSQANWLASAAEARQLADELIKNVEILRQFWSGPAADSYYRAMQAIIQFASALSTDMTNMANGLSQMSMMATTIKPQALAIINSSRYHSWTRAAAIAPLTALLNQLGGCYTSNRNSYWKEPTQAPEQLPKAGNEQNANPQEGREAGKVSPVDLLDRLQDLRQITETGKYIYDAFNPDEFPSGVIGDFPGNGGLPDGDYPGFPGGGNGGVPGWDGSGPLPDPDHPDYQPLPEPDTELTDPNAPPETSLASAAPAGMAGPPPAMNLATGSGPGMGGGMGAVPMGGMGMGMGAAGSAARGSAPSSGSRPPVGGGGGMMGPGMMGGAGRGAQQQEESGHRTWLTEDEMAWDGDAAPSGVVGGPSSSG